MKEAHFLIITLALFSCSYSNKPSVYLNPEEQETIADTILGSINYNQVQFDGCACYFSFDTIQFKNSAYGFVSDNSNGYIKIHQKLIRLELRSSVEYADESFIEEYFNDSLTIKINANKISETDESSFYILNLDLFKRETKLNSFSMVGECGC